MDEAFLPEKNKIYSAKEAYQEFNDVIYNKAWFCCQKQCTLVLPVRGYNGGLPFFRRADEEASLEQCIFGESNAHRIFKMTVFRDLMEDFYVRFDGVIPFILTDLSGSAKIESFLEGNERRADVLYEFSNPNKLLGKGVCFEIQLSTQTASNQEKREKDWLSQGYSIVWLGEENFLDGHTQQPISIVKTQKEYLTELSSQEIAEFQTQINQLKQDIFEYKNQIKHLGSQIHILSNYVSNVYDSYVEYFLKSAKTPRCIACIHLSPNGLCEKSRKIKTLFGGSNKSVICTYFRRRLPKTWKSLIEGELKQSNQGG